MSKYDFIQAENSTNTTINTPGFEIHNYRSDIDNFYCMNTPFQLTYECCSGISSADYLTITNLSPVQSDYTSIPMDDYQAFNASRSLHHHDYYEFMFILEGEAVNRIEDKLYTYCAGTCCLMNRNIRHVEVLNCPAKILFLGLTPKFISELMEFCKTDHFREELDSLNDVILKFIKNDMDNPGKKEYLDFFPIYQNRASIKNLHELADSLMRIALVPAYGASYLIRGVICSLIQYISTETNYHVTHVDLEYKEDFLLFSHISQLLEDTDGRVTRQMLADICNYSGTHINRTVKKYSGMCLFDYSMTFCMKKAANLLAETDDSISSIMEKLNFHNANHFYKIFDEYYHTTPLKYRKMQR